ncbi:MAG: hypothetical protein DRP75_00840 [Candidatus Omnitrophota bacterium]|nr:MAG: hypothetical protein DRP75_00840 [Candidatus Omnitrophota bacterium]
MEREKIRKGDSVYVRSRGWVSRLIVLVSTGGKRDSRDCPSHEARVFDIVDGEIKLIEVVFTGKRYISLDKYLSKKGIRIWVKRDEYLLGERGEIDEAKVESLLSFLKQIKVKGYDWRLFLGLGIRGVLRKVFRSGSRFNWVTRILDSKIAFVCSEFQNAGRRYIGMNIPENETPADDMRKIPARMITTYASEK